MLLRHNKDIVVLYNLYATNMYGHTGPNHFVVDRVYRITHNNDVRYYY